MITQGMNIMSEHSKSNLEFNGKLEQITFADTRVYKRAEDLFYPSVTTILQYMPKGKFFETWLKDVGHNAEIILQRAGKEGTQVHEAVEALVKGEEVTWLDNYGNAKYSILVWKMIIKFHDFWTTYKPTLISSEDFIYSDTHKYAGTMDLVVELEGEKWLLDVKTSNSLYRSYDLQLAAYATALKEAKGIKVDRTGILWLKASTRGSSSKKGVMQGEGWQIKPADEIEKNFKLFKTIYDLYTIDHPNPKPAYNTYPISLKF